MICESSETYRQYEVSQWWQLLCVLVNPTLKVQHRLGTKLGLSWGTKVKRLFKYHNSRPATLCDIVCVVYNVSKTILVVMRLSTITIFTSVSLSG